ncbi:MAG: TonB-dependent receptor [Pseudomonadota bacterium]
MTPKNPARLATTAISLCLLMAAAMLTAPVHAQSRGNALAKDVSLEAGDLKASLFSVSSLFDVNVVATDELVVGKTAPDISGRLTADETIGALLVGSGLSFERSASGAFVLKTATNGEGNTQSEESTEPTSDDPESLEEIVVFAHSRDYDPTVADTFQLGLDILKTPASVSVISQDLLQDLQVNNIDEALRNVAGITRQKNNNGGGESVSIRGFGASVFKDGAPVASDLIAASLPSTEPANLERVEVLKGPSALLYGEGGPGGLINYVTKRPQSQRSTSIELLAGSYDFFKVEFDTTGAFSENSTFAYRLVGTYEDSESFRDEVTRERLLINPSISWSNDRASVVAGVEYIDDDFTQDRGQVLDGDLFGGYFYGPNQDVDQFYGIPGFNDQSVAESTRAYILADYQVLPNWRVEATVQNTENDKLTFDTNNDAVTPTFGFIGAEGTPRANTVSISAGSADATGTVQQYTIKNFIDLDGPGGVEHQILASYTFEEFDVQGRGMNTADTVFYNIVTGVYTVNTDPTPVDNPADLLNLTDSGPGVPTNFEESGINVLDFINLNEKWGVLLGFRYSNYVDNVSDFEDDDLSFRGGVVYSFSGELSAFLSYAEGYTSSGGRLDLDDEIIDPATSTSWEVGMKWQPNGDRLLVTGTLYDVVEEDVAFLINPQAPPLDRRFGNIGEYESLGFELEVVGKVTDAWRIQAGYSYIDNEIIDGGTTLVVGPFSFGFEAGGTLPGIPEHGVNLASFYEVPLFSGQFGFGGSLNYQDDIFISGENNATYDGWVEVGAMTYFRRDNWKAQLNVINAFDEDYRLTQANVTPDAFAAIRVGTSRARTVIASLSYEF